MSALDDKTSREQVHEKKNVLQLKDKEQERSKLQTVGKGVKEVGATAFTIAKKVRSL